MAPVSQLNQEIYLVNPFLSHYPMISPDFSHYRMKTPMFPTSNCWEAFTSPSICLQNLQSTGSSCARCHTVRRFR